MPKKVAILAFFLIYFLLIVSLIRNTSETKAAATHVVISEVQTRGAVANDEFVELYNPTDTDIEISGWRLRRKTEGGSESNLVSSISGTIQSHGYFLIAHPEFDGGIAIDQEYSATSSGISLNNTVLLYEDAGITLVDKVGLENAGDFEGIPIGNPPNNGSVERKAFSSSTVASMEPGGADEFAGNGEDTDDNNSDFIIRTTSDPQNSSSAKEPSEATPTPTEETSPTPTEELTPTPTEEPSPTPTEEASPTPTEEPTPSPEITETPSPTPTEEPTPTPAGKTIGLFSFPGRTIRCTLSYRFVNFGFFKAFFPNISCTRL